MLLAGGLAGWRAPRSSRAPLQNITSNSYGTYGFDGITVALLGRASPVGVVLAALLFGALHAGGTNMEAATQVPVGHRRGAPGPDRAVRGGPAADPGDVPAAPGRGRGPRGRVPKGWNAVTTLAAATGAPISVNRRMVAAGTFIRVRADRHLRVRAVRAPRRRDVHAVGSQLRRSRARPSMSRPPRSPTRSARRPIVIGLFAAFVDESRAVRRLNIAPGAAVLRDLAAVLGLRGQRHPAQRRQPAAGHDEPLDPARARRPRRTACASGRA